MFIPPTVISSILPCSLNWITVLYQYDRFDSEVMFCNGCMLTALQKSFPPLFQGHTCWCLLYHLAEYSMSRRFRSYQDIGYWIIRQSYAGTAQSHTRLLCDENTWQTKGKALLLLTKLSLLINISLQGHDISQDIAFKFVIDGSVFHIPSILNKYVSTLL